MCCYYVHEKMGIGTALLLLPLLDFFGHSHAGSVG